MMMMMMRVACVASFLGMAHGMWTEEQS